MLFVSCKDEELASFTITFDSDGGSAVDPITVFDGGSAEAPKPPVKENYEFLGWYYSGQPYTFGSSVQRDITLTAKWKAKEYTISFNPENGESTFSLIAVYGEEFTVPVPKREGYNFLGWYRGDEKCDFGSITGDCSVFARWVASSDGLAMELSEDEKSYTVTGIGDFSGTELTVPSHYNGKPVTLIGANALSGAPITSLRIPGTVTKVDFMAFSGCTSLTDLIIDEGVDNISSAFYGCTALKNVTLADSITRLDNAFFGCTALENVTLPASTVSANNAFRDCTSLGLTESANGLYVGTRDNPYYMLVSVVDKSIESLKINTGTVIIHTAAVKDCASLTELSIPATVKYIYGNAFMGCSGLTTMIIPSSVTVVAAYAFANCTELRTVYVPSSVKEVGYHAFDCCDNVTVNCAVSKTPEGWDPDWNLSFTDEGTVSVKVVWGSGAIG